MRLADGRVLRTIRAPDLAPAKPFVWDLLLLGVGISLAGVILAVLTSAATTASPTMPA
jgi:hypothetical protein